MKRGHDELITRLNNLIADVNPEEIMGHVENGTLDDWIQAWRMEAASCSFGLYVYGAAWEDRVNNINEIIKHAKEIIDE